MTFVRSTLLAVVAVLGAGCAGYHPPIRRVGTAMFVAESVAVSGSRWEFLKALRLRVDARSFISNTIIQSEDGFTALLPWTGDPRDGAEALTGAVAVIFFSGAAAPVDQPTRALVCTGSWRIAAVTHTPQAEPRELADQAYALERLCAAMAANGY